jgi:hypothetical protein
MAPADVRHSEISRALAKLAERAGPVEVATALECDWEPFEAQMRRRMRTRPQATRDAYRSLARAGSTKVRTHLEATGVLPTCEGPARRSPGAVVRVRDRSRRRRRRSDHCGGRR